MSSQHLKSNITLHEGNAGANWAAKPLPIETLEWVSIVEVSGGTVENYPSG